MPETCPLVHVGSTRDPHETRHRERTYGTIRLANVNANVNAETETPPDATPPEKTTSEKTPSEKPQSRSTPESISAQLDDLFAAVHKLEAFATTEAKRVQGELIPQLEEKAKKNLWLTLLFTLTVGIFLGAFLTGGRRRG